MEENMIPLTATEEATGRVFVTVDGEEIQFLQEDVDLSMESSEEDIMNRIAPMIEESKGIDITDSYKVRKMVNTENIFILPNSTAGL